VKVTGPTEVVTGTDTGGAGVTAAAAPKPSASTAA
jgi:hypothetical protein